jgi:flagellar protein FlbT
MSLRIELKPFEKLLIGDMIVSNSEQKAMFILDGVTPVLRMREFLAPEAAKTPAERLYVCIQNILLARDREKNEGAYLALAAESAANNPELYAALALVDEFVTKGQHYKALKALKKLISADIFPAAAVAMPGYRPRIAFGH